MNMAGLVVVCQAGPRGGSENTSGLEADLNEKSPAFLAKQRLYRPPLNKAIFDDDEDLPVISIGERAMWIIIWLFKVLPYLCAIAVLATASWDFRQGSAKNKR
jgi:hypothetical protein